MKCWDMRGRGPVHAWIEANESDANWIVSHEVLQNLSLGLSSASPCDANDTFARRLVSRGGRERF